MSHSELSWCGIFGWTKNSDIVLQDLESIGFFKYVLNHHTATTILDHQCIIWMDETHVFDWSSQSTYLHLTKTLRSYFKQTNHFQKLSNVTKQLLSLRMGVELWTALSRSTASDLTYFCKFHKALQGIFYYFYFRPLLNFQVIQWFTYPNDFKSVTNLSFNLLKYHERFLQETLLLISDSAVSPQVNEEKQIL